ncbi:hypothetical protein BDV93DRAFT_508516 [Ceratobasidium sp. AG-I]|nr:hypothetical protein BDV93DRAFT_508516 [Ceratobasidium sp. AG-I]
MAGNGKKLPAAASSSKKFLSHLRSPVARLPPQDIMRYHNKSTNMPRQNRTHHSYTRHAYFNYYTHEFLRLLSLVTNFGRSHPTYTFGRDSSNYPSRYSSN